MLVAWGCVLQHLRNSQPTAHVVTETVTKTGTKRRHHDQESDFSPQGVAHLFHSRHAETCDLPKC